MDAYLQYRASSAAWLAKLGLTDACLPTLEPPDEGVYVQAKDGVLELLYTERGQSSLIARGDVEALVYASLRSITGSQALAHELRNRRLGEDSRRQWMADHVRRMSALREDWGEAVAAEYDAVLREHPFDDALARRSERWDVLRRQGLSREEAVKQAEREIPSVPPRPEDRRLR